MKELHLLDISEVTEAFAGRRLSPVEYATALLARIESVNPTLHAFVEVFGCDLINEARKAEQEIHQSGPRTPLHGIPIGVKDVIDVGGVRTTCHSKILLDNVATRDAQVVKQLRAAGAVMAGKTATWEFALGGPSFDLPFPAARKFMEPRPSSRRILDWIGGRGSGAPHSGRAWDRYGRIDPITSEPLRSCWAEADEWPGERSWCLPLVLFA